MDVLEPAVGFIALVVLLGAVIYWLPPRDPPPVEVDLAAPYREGLHAAIRMQVVAHELEQQLYAEALRCVASDSGGGEQ